jgi:hypothetical protein
MLGPLNQQIGRKLASFIVAFGLAFTLQPIPASAGNDNKSCQPTVPYDLSHSEFEELRDKIWETGGTKDLELSFEIRFKLSDHPFFLLLLSAKYIDRGSFIEPFVNFEAIEDLSRKVEFCQYVFISELASSLRYAAIKSLISKDTRNLGAWNGFGHGGMRYFSLNDYETAKCIILDAGVETLKLDREPTWKEYPRHCMVH